MAIDWSNLSNGEAQELLSTDFSTGLTKKAVAYRRKRLGKNTFLHKYSSHIKMLEKNFFSFSLITLLLCVCVSFFVIPRIEAVILSVSLIAFLSILALEYLNIHNLSVKAQLAFTKRVITIRDGKERLLFPDSLVVGDVIKLSKGEELPFDAFIVFENDLLIEGRGVINSGIIEGGSKIMNGSCTCAIVDIKGRTRKEKTESGFIEYFSESISVDDYGFSSKVAILLYVATALISLFIIIMSKSGSVGFESFFSGIIISNGILPCFVVGIYAFIYRNLFFNPQKRLNLKGAKSVKMLTELECVVFDSSLIFNNETPSPIAFYTGGTTFSKDGFNIEDRRVASFKNALFSVEHAILSIENANKNKANSISSLFGDRFVPQYPLASYRLKSDDFPFDTFSLKSSEDETVSVVKGDLYSILKRCISASYNEKGSPLDEASKSAIIDAAQKLAALGLEIEAYALCAKDGFSLDSTHLAHKRLSFLGFVAYSKGLSPKCEELFTLCEGKGIEPIIIHNGTKEELGLLLSGSGYLKRLSYVDCNTLGEDEATLRTALSSYNVYLNPSEKQLDVIIKIISKNDIKSAYISRQNGNAPFVLKYASEICKNETENEIVFTDQTPDLFALLCSSYDLKRRFSLVLRFLAFLSLSRISMSTLSLFFGVSVLSPLSASILTFAIDAFSLFVLLSDRLEKASDEDAVTASLLSLKSLASILALPFIILMSATAMKLFYSQDTATIVTALCFYSQTLLAPLYMLFVLKVRLSERLLAYLLGILIFISLISMFSPFGNLLRVISDVKLLFASLLLTLIFLLFYRKITKNN